MRRSERQVNQAYFKIEKKYFDQQILLNSLLDEINEECTVITDSLRKDLLPHISEPKGIRDYDFDQFRAAREKQENIEQLINNMGQFLSANCQGLSSEIFVKVERLEIGQKDIVRDWGDYNSKVRMHNTYIKKFPRNFYSNFFKFRSKPYYKVEE